MRFFLCLLALAVGFQAQSQTLFLADSNNDVLYTVDPLTGAATNVGPTGPAPSTPAGLAHDGSSLYALDLGGAGGLYTLDPNTAAPTFVGSTGLTGWQDFAWDPGAGLFYAVRQDDTLHSIDLTGTATLIGSTPTTLLLTAVAVDAGGTLWAMDFLGGALGTLDRSTGAFTQVNTAINGFQGISFDANGVLYGANTGSDSLYIIDTTPASAGGGGVTLVGAFGGTPAVVFSKGMCFQLGAPAFATVIGSGCLGPGGVTALITQQPPSIGNLAFNVEVSSGSPTTATLLYVAPAPGSTSIGSGCSIYLDLPGLLNFISTGIGPFPGTTNALGSLVYPLPIPNQPLLAGLNLTFQAAVFDTQAPLGFTTSNGLQILIN